MEFSDLGLIARDELLRSSGMRKEIRLNEDEMVVMPNHVHAIVWLIEVGADGVCPKIGEGKGASWIDQGACHAPQQEVPQPAPQQEVPQPAPQPAPQLLKRNPKSLGSFIAGYKASVTSRAGRELNMTGIWQRNYYEHIIRNEEEHKRIYQYIESNPVQWSDDEENPARQA